MKLNETKSNKIEVLPQPLLKALTTNRIGGTHNQKTNWWKVSSLFLLIVIGSLMIVDLIQTDETVNIGGIEITPQDACNFYKVYGSTPFYLTDIETGNNVPIRLVQNPCEVFGLE